MWHYSFHVFTSQQQFLDIVNQLKWPKDPLTQEIVPPQGIALDIVGKNPIKNTLNDTSYHVNIAWHARDILPEFVPSQITPKTPWRKFL